MNLKGKTINDFTQEQRDKMSADQRRELRVNTKLIMKKNGYYDGVRRLRKDDPLREDDKMDYFFGKSIEIFE
ncbi:TPA: hypothetical protein P6W17_002307 [Staphylococcus aureus]|nr:hypothetical protein [Staphylococcus aureus]HDP5870757.1 hypothetical protein [Staphylococcus aureus]HDP5926203.1 hypothetical protein [Staphylococcus aureus]HDP6029063.1 hypothetical protein [Staphylococcus aureus]HDP6109923.1 hypothetical protein [Staphylococcus aureus]